MRTRDPNRLFRNGTMSVGILASYVLAYAVVEYAFTPVQGFFLPEITTYASLCYLPHGVKVIATWFYRWKALPAIYAGGFFGAYFFWGSQVAPSDLIIPIAVSAVSAYVALLLISLSGRSAFFDSDKTDRKIYVHLIGVGLASSIFNSIALLLIAPGHIFADMLSITLVAHIVGDNIGLIALLFILMLFFRAQRRLS